jgi:hypothetical protein
MERFLQNASRGISMCCTAQFGGPMKSILDPSFRYTKSVETDLRKTFARVRRELGKQPQGQSADNASLMRKVLPVRAR